MHFILIGDLHVHADEQDNDVFFGQLWEYIRQVRPRVEFAAFLGDITADGRRTEYRRAKRLLAECPVPWVLARGNHDKGPYAARLGDAEASIQIEAAPRERRVRLCRWNSYYWEETQESTISPARPTRAHYAFYDDAQEPICAVWDSYRADYAFEAQGLRFVVVDTSRWRLTEDQFAWLEAELALGTPTILFMHHHLLPVRGRYDAIAAWQAPRLLELVRRHDNVRASFHGHVHANRIWDYHGRPIVTTAYRNVRLVTAASDGHVEVGPSSGPEAPPQPYRHWDLAPSGLVGTHFTVRDPRLWRFDAEAAWCGKAWGGPHEEPQGLSWQAFIDNDHCGRPCRARFCFVARGPWRAEVAAVDGDVLATVDGKGTEARQEAAVDVTFNRAAEYRLSLVQPEGTDETWIRCADLALLDFGDEQPPEGWCWGNPAGPGERPVTGQ